MAIFMVVILLLPTAVKIEHHHDHFICHAHNEKHFHDHHEKCPVCNFEFSVFCAADPKIRPANAALNTVYIAPLYNFIFPDYSKYSFLLRAPPISTNSI